MKSIKDMFSFKTCHRAPGFEYTFEQCKLKTKLLSKRAGSKIGFITIDFVDGSVTFTDKDGVTVIAAGQLKMQIDG